jgi:5'-nucleotidase
MKWNHVNSEERLMSELIALFDLDGTLADYNSALLQGLNNIRSPGEPKLDVLPRGDDTPIYLRTRMNMIRESADWWVNIPRLGLGSDIWNITESFGFRHMILTAGPKRFPNSWSGKKMWVDKNLGPEVDITITRDKSLVYGSMLVDDWPDYVTAWLKWRKRGLVIMPASPHNIGFTHPQVIRYDGENYKQAFDAIAELRDRHEEAESDIEQSDDNRG